MARQDTSYWRSQAERVIAEVHASLPIETDLKARTAAIDAAYPFGARRWHPYKVWLKERRKYLVKFGYKPRTKAAPETPLERLMRRGGVGQ